MMKFERFNLEERSFGALNWDEFWQGKLEASLREKTQTALDDYEIEGAECRLHAERLIHHLQDSFPDVEFAGNDCFGWSILARTKSKGKLSEKKRDKVQSAAARILENIERKYPIEEQAKSTQPGQVTAELNKPGCLIVFGILVAGIILAGVLFTTRQDGSADGNGRQTEKSNLAAFLVRPSAVAGVGTVLPTQLGAGPALIAAIARPRHADKKPAPVTDRKPRRVRQRVSSRKPLQKLYRPISHRAGFFRGCPWIFRDWRLGSEAQANSTGPRRGEEDRRRGPGQVPAAAIIARALRIFERRFL